MTRSIINSSLSLVTIILIAFICCSNARRSSNAIKCSSKCRCTKTFAYCIYGDITSEELKDILPTISATTTKLYLNGNKITKVDMTDFKHLPNLIYLNMNFNRIENLPKEINRYLPKLNTLHLTANRIITISSQELKGYENLKTLNLDQNLIETISNNTFSEMSDLRILLLGQNKLTNVNQHTFKGLSNLIKLQLSDNAIIYLHEDAFQSSLQLQELYLYVNKITRVQKGLFAGLHHLRIVYLSDNFISEIEEGAFDNLSLETVYLNLNLLTRLPNHMFKGTQVSGNIFLLDNLFKCDCKFAKAIKQAKANVRQQGDAADDRRLQFGDCKSPENLSITSVTVDALNCTVCDLGVCPSTANCTVDPTSKKGYQCIGGSDTVTGTKEVAKLTEPSNNKISMTENANGLGPEYIYWIIGGVSILILICLVIVVILIVQSRRKRKEFDMVEDKYIYEKVNGGGGSPMAPKLTNLTAKNSFNMVNAPIRDKVKQYFV